MVDQFGFLTVALAISLLVDPGWTLATFTPAVLLVAVLSTPLAHRATNRVAYRLGLKRKP